MSRSLKNTGERSFTISNAYHIDGCPTKFSHKDYSGRYTGMTPAGAAAKALTNLCHSKNIRGQCALYIEMRETTQGSNHKLYGYKCRRVKKAEPVEVAGSMRMYDTIVHSAKIPKEKCNKSHKSSGAMKGSRRMRLSSSRKHLSAKTKKNRA